MNSFCSGVSIPPGATQFARMPRLMYSSASALREVHDAGLRRAVRGAVRLRLDARVRRDVHDRAAAVEQVRERGLAHEERAGEVHADDALPVLERHLVRVGEPADARAVDDELRPAEVARRAVDRGARTEPGRRRRPCTRAPSPPCSAISAAVFSAASPAMSRQPTAAPSDASRMRRRVPEPRTRARDDRHASSNRPMSTNPLDDERPNLTQRQISTALVSDPVAQR